jgi:hypothetical protein
MKSYILVVLAAVFIAGCSNKPASTDTQPAAAAQSTPSKAASSQTAASQPASGAPVEFTYGGITADKANISYKIKVNTDKPIEEVHLAFKATDAGGKVLDQSTIAWQNIVKSSRQPIEKGKTYEDTSAIDPAAAKVECSLKEVVFKDGTTWKSK